jgi:hypothetical protein
MAQLGRRGLVFILCAGSLLAGGARVAAAQEGTEIDAGAVPIDAVLGKDGKAIVTVRDGTPPEGEKGGGANDTAATYMEPGRFTPDVKAEEPVRDEDGSTGEKEIVSHAEPAPDAPPTAEAEEDSGKGRPFAWCSLQEEMQKEKHGGGAVTEVYVTGPEFGFAGVGTVAMCDPSALRIVVTATEEATGISIRKSASEEKRVMERTDSEGTGRPGRSFSFDNGASAAKDGSLLLERGENRFLLAVERTGVKDPVEMEIPLRIVAPKKGCPKTENP